MRPLRTASKKSASPTETDAAKRSVYVRQAIRLLLHKPAAVGKVTLPAGLESLEVSGMNLLRDMLAAAAEEPGIKPARFAEQFAEHQDGGGALATLLTQELHLDEGANWGAQLQDTLNAILREALERRQEDLIARMENPGGLSEAEKDEFRALPARLAELRPGGS